MRRLTIPLVFWIACTPAPKQPAEPAPKAPSEQASTPPEEPTEAKPLAPKFPPEETEPTQSALLRLFLTSSETVELAGTKTVDGRLACDKRVRWTYMGPTEFQGEQVHRQGYGVDAVCDGKEVTQQMIFFQHIDDERSITRGYQKAGKPPVGLDSEQFVDLAAPLEVGHEWTFIHPSSYYRDIEGHKVVLEWSSKVIQTNASLDTPAGKLSGCVKTESQGRSLKPFEFRCSGGIERAHLEHSTHIYFCSGLGNVWQRARETVVSIRGEVCSTTRSEYEAVKIW
ncbi:hypothetical protein ACFL6C_12010 [Myxococcota bacterium]